MKRAKLLGMMLAMLLLIAAVVAFASPYEPVVGGVAEIETLWAIEDARQESEEPLVTALSNHGVPLAYDREENTFYCTLGLETGDNWPQLHLTAPGAKGVDIVFSDDYSYDWCADAIAGGYAYELMAYDDTSYSYFYIVFTGLPIISVQADAALSTEETPVTAVFSAGGETLKSRGEMHMRGNGTLENDKKSYKLTLTDGTKKASQQVPGLCETDEIILLSMVVDETMMHDRLCWELVSRMTQPDAAFAPKANGYAELFIDGEYAGVYLMLDPYDSADEIAKAGGEAPLHDGLYRTAHDSSHRDGGRAYAGDPLIEEMCYELFYTAKPEAPFAALDDYFALQTMDDAAFAEYAPQVLDMRSFLAYDLLIQATGMMDTVHNNTYFWAHMDNGKYRYRVLPWDMDLAWGIDMGDQADRWIPFNTVDRMLSLDAGGARGLMLGIWREMRDNGFDTQTLQTLTDGYARELNDSGAAAREAAKWGRTAATIDGFPIVSYAGVRFELMDKTLEAIAAEPDKPIAFLEGAEYKAHKAKFLHILGE